MNQPDNSRPDRWLAVSTSGPIWSVYLGPRSGEGGTQVELQAPRGHARDLLGAIEDLLTRAQIAFGDLAGVAVDSGPGSFTSLRMGLATVRALAWACNRPLAAATSLAALAAEASAGRPTDPVFSLVPARRGWWYVGCGTGAHVAEQAVVADADLPHWVRQRGHAQALAAGSWPESLGAELGLRACATDAQPKARWLLACMGEPGPALAVMPAYLAASEAEIAKGWTAPDLALEAVDRCIPTRSV
ncbi:MAG: tRNA (adenosine(37)-N6)-threonylcarbamoyltransferase complex dimerization subunit type 1 TsaB [Deltaproteobacteria bacterium]|nr:tRNA (adenosine(37)-N6)-threonylcarbamoyltransferase complex dimerization subunit type 1 TsaB [Deltaproteobacteria bacterium]